MRKDTDDGILLMSSPRVKRAIHRIAYQIAEDNKDEANTLIVGLKKRGFVIARLIAEYLEPLTAKKVALQQFIPSEGLKNNEETSHNFPYVVLVDDVIFSGRTMLEALQLIFKNDNQTVRTAVLVDRGHRSVPINATFTGLQLPTKLDEHVQVITSGQGVTRVVLNNSSA